MVMVSFPQVILGICYLAANFGVYQTYAESGELIKISRTFLLDEYTGILYPVLLAACRAAERITSIPFLYSLDLIQLAAFFLATVFLIKTVSDRKLRMIQALYLSCVLFTAPVLLQAGLAVLPFSLALSCFEVFLGAGIYIIRKLRRTEKVSRSYWILLGVAMMSECLLVPDSFWLGTAFLLILLVMIPKQKKILAAFLLTACICVSAVQVLMLLTVQPGSHGKIQNSFAAAMVSRFVWPNFATNYFFWDDEVKAVMTLNDSVYICQREDAVSDYFGPMMEKAYGRQEANRIYLTMAERCFQDRTKEGLKDIAEDFVDYLFMPVTIQRNLEGSGTSENAWNYAKMREHTPEIAKYYFRSGILAFDYLFICSAVLWFRKFLKRDRQPEKGKRDPGYILLAGNLLIYAFWYTMRSNSPVDYKAVLPVILIWYLLSAEPMAEAFEMN